MQLWDSVMGYIKYRIISADLMGTINKISAKYNIYRLEILDDITATFLSKRLEAQDAENVEIIGKIGMYWTIMRLFQRPVLLVGMLMFAILLFWLPTRVLFISVSGNKTTSAYTILEAAKECGITFGASRNYVRSEKVKNTLLQMIPTLQWACVNTSGCVAEITVQERSGYSVSSGKYPGNIIAGNDGIITDITVYKGTALCRPGQVVQKGQLLVSGYMDLGLMVKEGRAIAEVRAETLRSVTAVALTNHTRREGCLRRNDRYSIIIGKKQINFYKGSGILPPECGRINKIYTLTLPGGFSLPVSVVKEEITYFHVTDRTDDDTDTFAWLSACAEESVMERMVAGEIIKKSAINKSDGSVCRLQALYRCREMIGITETEELYTGNE